VVPRPTRPAPTARPAGRPAARPATGKPAKGDVVLDVQNLKTYFFTYDGVVHALDGVNLTVRAGETTGLVGETGCGKSVTAFSIARLVSEPGRVMSGKVLFRDADLLWGLGAEARFKRVRGSDRVKVIRSFRRIRAANDRLSSVRGKRIAMIFQEPSQAMNPVFSIGNQLGEALLLHRGLEVVDGLLAADRKRRQVLGTTGASRTADLGLEAAAASTSELGGAIAALVQEATAESEQQEGKRTAAAKVAELVGLPSAATELFYLARHAGPGSAGLQRRMDRALRRIELTGMQRRYLRHRRRMIILQQAMNDLHMKEMRIGKSQRASRGAVSLAMTAERLRHIYFRLWGIRQRVDRPLQSELFWRSVELLEGMRIANPTQVARGYPHELSGGMIQRAMIAMALSCEPELLIADEPTTALDVTIQAQILDLMRQVRERVGTAIVLITHDLGVVAEVCDFVNVMYAGLIVESAPVTELFRRPLHPYTQGLLASIPRFDQPDRELVTIAGSVPNLINPPAGCRFHPRCPYAMPICKEKRPESLPVDPDHYVACHLYTVSSEESGSSTPLPSSLPLPAQGVSPQTPARA